MRATAAVEREPAAALTIGAALAAGVDRIRAGAPEDARLTCEWLVSRITGRPRLELPLRLGERLTAPQAARLDAGLARLARGEPLAYVLGEADFRGRLFACDPRALIPRPETEQLADAILAWAPLWRRRAPAVADVGTGCGCIAITLALERPAGRYTGTDISSAALDLARDNAARHAVGGRIRWREADLLAGVEPGSLDAVVSNPPYVTTGDWARIPRAVREFEPRLALDAGPDGLAVIRRLAAHAWPALAPGGGLFMEIGETQGAAVQALLEATGFQAVRIEPDWTGKDRIACAAKGAMGRA